MPLRVTSISVSFESSAILHDMFQHIPQGVRPVLVDNGSSDQATSKALAEKHGARFVALDENQGFGTACNRGAERAETEFLLFLNPDARISDLCLTQLLDHMDQHPNVVATAPALIEANGSSHFKRGSHLISRRTYAPKSLRKTGGTVPVLHGAVLLIRRDAFAAVGGFDEQIFLYYEDDDLSLRLRKAGGVLSYLPQAQALHDGGTSTVRTGSVLAFKSWHAGFSRVQMLKKHRRLGALVAMPLSLWMRKKGSARQDPISILERDSYAQGGWFALKGGHLSAEMKRPETLRLKGQ